MIIPFGKNILIQPAARTQVLVTDQGSLCEYGKVVAIGDDVTKIKVGDTIGFLVWGIQKLDIRDTIYYFVPENSDFILGTITEDIENGL